MDHRGWVLGVLSLVVTAPVRSEPGATARVAVSYVHSPDHSPRHNALFEAQLVLELNKRHGLSAHRLDVKSQSDADACSAEPSCLANLARAVEAEIVVMARIAELGATKVVTLKRLSLASGEITH